MFMEQQISHRGRPAGRRKTAKIEVVIEPAIKEEFMRMPTNQANTPSVEIGSWIRQSIKEKQAENGGATK